jgi:hypothetical protein
MYAPLRWRRRRGSRIIALIGEEVYHCDTAVALFISVTWGILLMPAPALSAGHL